ncbi:MAG: hypothetical protein ACI837_000293 [Crocinitomicaceae bacterium]|jgi:hypothetical protein
MLAPGSDGWISKYFDFVERGELWVSIRNYEELSLLKHCHLTFSRCGIIFGLPTRAIFGHKLNTENWTREEKLKVLLLEALLFVHLKTGGKLDKESFIQSLLAFYGDHNVWSLKKVLTFFRKEKDDIKLEKILEKRVDIKMNLLENKWWVNSLNNAFVYLDVILYHDFVVNKSTDAISKYSDFAQNSLTAITLSSYADGEISPIERDLFNLFLASANLSDEQREIAHDKFEKGATLDDFDNFIHHHWLLKRFLMDLSLLTVFSDLHAVETERSFIEDLRKFMNIPEEEMEEAMMFIENFIITNRDQSDFLKDAPSYELVYGSFTNRWKKVLSRNKDKLAIELKESKELVTLMKKSMSEDLSAEEKKKVKTQLKDILKSMPAVAIFLIPGGTILLPMMMKIIPDLLPSAFKDNQIEE